MSATYIELAQFPGYLIGDDGTVIGTKMKKPLRPEVFKSGHLRVGVRDREGKRRKVFIHRLVLGAFVGRCPEGMEGCHNDGNPANNRLENLRWDTRGNNQKDSIRHGTHNTAGRSKMRCPQGHEYSPDNTYINANKPGDKRCRTCARENLRKWYDLRKS